MNERIAISADDGSLPNLDCGGCGRETCYDLAREIVAGSGSVEDKVEIRF